MSAAVQSEPTERELFAELRSAVQRRDLDALEVYLDWWAELYPHTFEARALPYVERVHAELLEEEALDAAREDFESFVRWLHPEYDLQWFHRRLCDEVQAWAIAAEPYGLVLELPPGHAKSTYAKLATAWLLGRDPDAHVAYASYSQDLADSHSSDIQQTILSERYAAAFPATRINDRRVVTDESRGARRTKDLFEVIGRAGEFRAVGVGGSLTGFRCDAIIVDDPVKDAAEAASPTIRRRIWEWYTRVASTRKRPGRPLRFLLLQTRWHLDDLTGRVLADDPGQWREVRYPALKQGPPTDEDPRLPGQALWRAVEDEDGLAQIRERDPEGFQALYQGRPVPAGGAVFKASWFERRWRQLPTREGTWLQSWDLRHGGKSSGSSYVVGQLWFKPHDRALAFLVDQVRGQWSTDETLAQFDAVQRRDQWRRATVRLIEHKADGVTLLSLRGDHYTGMTPVSPGGRDKATRARGVTPACRSGNVILPQDAVWLPGLEAELFTFPAAAHDDQVDAFSQALDCFFVEQDEAARAKRTFEAMIS